MKRTLLIISAATVLLAGCAKEQLVEERSYTGPVTVVGATFESLTEDGTTKASVSDAGAFTWQNGDKAAFAESSSSTSYCFGTNSVAGATAQFAIEGSHTFTNSSLAIYPDDLTKDQVPTNLKVKVPASRVWVNEQTNVAMYGKYETASSSFSFSHMGGLVRVRVKNVPTNAREFVFKASGCKINGEFTVETESTYKVIKTATANTESEQTYTLTWTAAPAAENTMDFYIPLPVGNYSGGFAFYLKDESHNILYSKVGTTAQTIARKKLLLMPAITLVGGSIEPIEKAAVVANIPAGYSGDFLLPQSEKVLLKINASTVDHNITLKYDGGTLPTNLEIKVVDGDNAGNYNAKLLGDLPSTHVEFTQGHIDATALTTSSSTFAVINPASVGTLTVNGGNVKIEGATVTSIVVAQNAVASEKTKAPVQIVVEKSEGESPVAPNVGTITANADVVVAPAANVEVKVEAAENVKVANGGEGTVKDKNENPITTQAAAKIGDIKYITLADAIAAVNNGDTIKLVANVDKAAGIRVESGKNFTVDFGGFSYAMECPGAGSAATKTAGFQLLQNSTIVFKNGTIKCTDANKDKTWSSGDASKGIAIMIQNYANLTLDGVTIDATNIAHNGAAVRYALSNNCGTVNYTGNTTINTKAGDYAFDVCKYDTYEAPTVTWNSTGSVDGIIELSGGTLELNADLCVNAPVYVTSSNKSTLNLNGKKIYNTSDIWEQDSAKKWFELIKVDGGKLTINDTSNGSVAAKPNDCYAVNVINEGVLEINGGTFKGNVSAVQVDKGTATINAGSFEQQQGTQYDKYLLNCVDANYKAETAKIIVKGGSFKGFNPADNAAEGANTNFVASGYTSTETSTGVWTVSEITGVAKIGSIQYETLAAAIAAVQNNQTIEMIADVNNAKGIKVDTKKTFTVDFKGHTYTVNKPGAGSKNTQTQAFQLLKGQTITFKNGTINCAVENKTHTWNTSDSNAEKGIAMIIQDYAELTLENMTIDGTNIAHNGTPGTVRYMVSSNYGNVTIKGNTSITAPEGDFAFDVYDNRANNDADYPGVPTVTVSTTGTITGCVEVTGGNLVVNGGTFKTTAARGNAQSNTILVKSGSLNVTNGTITSDHNTAVRIEGGSATLEGGTFTGTEGAVTFPGTGATINITGGTYNASDNAVLIGQGSEKTGNANNVTISGGTFNGGITSNGYIACGIYAPWKDIINVNGGTFNITGGAGVVARAGVVTINGGTFKCTGTATGKVGDKAVDLPCECLIFDDSDPSYPAKTNDSKIIVKKGTFSDESAIKYAANGADINIALQANRDASGIFLGENKNVKVTFDLGGKILNFKAPAVGSSGTENQAFHIEQGNQLFTLKNGKVTIDADAKSAFRFIIQNYNNLTVDGVELDGTNLAYNVNDKVRYTVSNNQGTVNFTGNTIIKAAAENGIAFDVCKNGSYTAPTVTWASSGSVTGEIELSGGTLELNADLCVNAPVYVTSSNKSTLNLNGKKLYNTSDIWEKDSAKEWGELIRVDGGKLEINDTENGSVAAKANDCYAVNVRENGELTINGGTFKGNVSAVQVVTGTATIEGGSFEQQQDTKYDKYVLNCIDANYQAGTAKIIVKGGSFKGFDPADNAAEGAGTNFVAEGYTSTENNGVWTVSQQN